MDKITRVSITFPPELLKDFDEIIEKMGYVLMFLQFKIKSCVVYT